MLSPDWLDGRNWQEVGKTSESGAVDLLQEASLSGQGAPLGSADRKLIRSNDLCVDDGLGLGLLWVGGVVKGNRGEIRPLNAPTVPRGPLASC